MVSGRRSACSRALYAGTKEIILRARSCRHRAHLALTFLSNVVAYACRHSRAEDRQMATPDTRRSTNGSIANSPITDCLLGATNEVLGDFFGVARRTIQNWIATRPDFAKAVRRGRAVADVPRREHALCRRLSGAHPLDEKSGGCGKGGKGGNPLQQPGASDSRHRAHGNFRASRPVETTAVVRLPKGHGPSVLPQPCATPRSCFGDTRKGPSMNTNRMRRRDLVSLLGGAAAVGVAGPAFAQAEPAKPAQIVVNHSGGSMGSAMRKAFFNGYEKKYGIRVVETSPADFGKLRAMVDRGNVEWDVTEIGGQDAIRAVKLGLVEKIDDKIVDRSKYPEKVRTPYVFASSVYTTIIGYRTDVFKDGSQPKSWADWWDVKKFPGARTMRNHPTDNLEFALIADGVPTDKLYPIDFDRAFKKLDQIKPHVNGVVDDRPAAGAAAARQGGRAGDRLERPLLRPHQEGRAGRDRMERGRAEAGQLRHPARAPRTPTGARRCWPRCRCRSSRRSTPASSAIPASISSR